MDPMTVSQEIGAKRRRATLGFLFTCDHYLVTAMTTFMQMLTVSKAKAGFSGIAREVIHTKKPVIVRVPHGFIQIAPYQLPEEVAPAQRGSIKRLPREVTLGNMLGDAP
jgi:hypothetical protein